MQLHLRINPQVFPFIVVPSSINITNLPHTSPQSPSTILTPLLERKAMESKVPPFIDANVRHHPCCAYCYSTKRLKSWRNQTGDKIACKGYLWASIMQDWPRQQYMDAQSCSRLQGPFTSRRKTSITSTGFSNLRSAAIINMLPVTEVEIPAQFLLLSKEVILLLSSTSATSLENKRTRRMTPSR